MKILWVDAIRSDRLLVEVECEHRGVMLTTGS